MRKAAGNRMEFSFPAIKISGSSFDQGLRQIEQYIEAGGFHMTCFCEANLLSHCMVNPRVLETLQNADLVFADGASVRRLALQQGQAVKERVPGPAFFLKAFEYGLDKGWRHYFYGATDDTLSNLTDRLQRKYPGIQIAGAYAPPFRALTDEEETQVKDMIESTRPHLLWVALGGPKQELWIADHLGKIDVPVMLGVGAAFDFHSGKRPWAPSLIRKIGMEWAFRMITGGKSTFMRNIWCVSIVGRLLLASYFKHYVLRRT